MSTSSDPFRIERDSMGEVRVPASAYYGAQTQRAVDNFPISGQPLPPALIHALGLVKWGAACVNRDLGCFAGSGTTALSAAAVAALIAAAREVADGQLDAQFPVDIFQTGSGTSSHMNANEVISHRAMELLGEAGAAPGEAVHPNDHVNRGQSSNDVFPTAIHVAVARSVRDRLIPALRQMAAGLAERASAWDEIVKIGRTHLNDATPIRLGQEFSGFARQFELAVARGERAVEAVRELPIGGTAIGTGLNTHPEFGTRVAALLAEETGLPFVRAGNLFESIAQRDALVECHGQLRSIAVTLFNVANNLRWLASGPRCGFNEIGLPDLQPGSSIMPGKVNPVLCESAMQVAAAVIGHDQTVAFAGATGGQFQLHVLMPILAVATLHSSDWLARVIEQLAVRYVPELRPHPDVCAEGIERSLALVTALNPLIGYERAAQLAHEALLTGKTIRELCLEQQVLPADQLDRVLDPRRMTGP